MIAVVTGGSRGIGKAIADALRASGATVTTFDRSHGVEPLRLYWSSELNQIVVWARR